MNVVVVKNQKVRIIPSSLPRHVGASVADYWIGKIGILKSWETGNWYTVECEGKELLLNAYEFEVLNENSD